MKKLLLTSIVLLLFSASLLLFQISCKKVAQADTPITQTDGLKQLGKILYKGSNRKEIYLANYDGTGKQKINFVFPSPSNIDDSIDNASMSPDGKTIFLRLYLGSVNRSKIYSCNVDGSNSKLVLDYNEFSQGESFYGAY